MQGRVRDGPTWNCATVGGKKREACASGGILLPSLAWVQIHLQYIAVSTVINRNPHFSTGFSWKTLDFLWKTLAKLVLPCSRKAGAGAIPDKGRIKRRSSARPLGTGLPQPLH